MKTIEEMHEMTGTELREYQREVYAHLADLSAIKDYRERIGEPKLLVQPTEVEFEEEE